MGTSACNSCGADACIFMGTRPGMRLALASAGGGGGGGGGGGVYCIGMSTSIPAW